MICENFIVRSPVFRMTHTQHARALRHELILCANGRVENVKRHTRQTLRLCIPGGREWCACAVTVVGWLSEWSRLVGVRGDGVGRRVELQQ